MYVCIKVCLVKFPYMYVCHVTSQRQFPFCQIEKLRVKQHYSTYIAHTAMKMKRSFSHFIRSLHNFKVHVQEDLSFPKKKQKNKKTKKKFFSLMKKRKKNSKKTNFLTNFSQLKLKFEV